jgi:hypothetical protein
VRFEEKRRKAVRNLGDAELRIGRDPTCDWIVDYANVSRHHAVIRPVGDRNLVQDLGSTNGIRVNGEALGGKPHVLAPGDVIELTDAVVLLYEEGPFSSSTPWVVTAIAMILLLIASLGLYLSTRNAGPGAGAPAGAASGTDAVPRESAETGGPERGTSGTHPGMHPPAESPQSQSAVLEPIGLPASGSLARSRASSPGRDDWTVADRVRSSGDRAQGRNGTGDSL